MTKPSKSKPSNKTAASPAEQPKETLKLRKEAAEPGVIGTTDTGAGKGDSATARGGEISPADSALVGKSATERAAAEPKPAPEQADMGKAAVTSAATEPETGPKDESKPGVPSVDSRSKPEAEPAGIQQAAANQPTATQQNVTVRKTGFWPVVFGGVVAAGLGAAATIWALPHLPAGWLPEQEPAIDAEAIRADAVTAAEEAARQVVAETTAADAGEAAVPADIQAMLEEQAGRIAALEAAGVAPSDAGGAPSDPDSASLAGGAGEAPVSPQDLARLQEQLEQQAAKLAELEARPGIDPEAAAKVQQIAEQADTLQQQISSAAEEAQAQISAAQAEATKLQEAAADSTKRAQAVAAVAALQAALDKGVTAQDAQQAFAEAGMDAPEALQQDIPSIETLQDSFGDASRAALRASLSTEGAQGGNMLTNFLKAQTGARSVAPREGDDPDAVLSRANARVEAGDIAAALEEMAALPDAAREAPAMAEWLAGATAFSDAQAALSDLSATTN